MRVKVVDSHREAAVVITAQQSGLPTQRSICWRFGNASNVVAPQGAETKVVDSHREAAVVITARQSGLPLAALHPLALWERQSHRRPRKMRKRKSLTATRKRPSSSRRSKRGYRLQHSIRWRFGNANHIAATARCGSESR